MDLHGALVDINVIPPDSVEQLFVGIDAARMARQIFEQAVFVALRDR